MTGPWRNRFAWLPTTIDGRRYWFQWVQRRRYRVVIFVAPFGEPVTQVTWQYRVKP